MNRATLAALAAVAATILVAAPASATPVPIPVHVCHPAASLVCPPPPHPGILR